MRNCKYNLLPPVNPNNKGLNAIIDSIRSVLQWRENPDSPTDENDNLGLEWLDTQYGLIYMQQEKDGNGQSLGKFPYGWTSEKKGFNYDRISFDTNLTSLLYFVKTGADRNENTNLVGLGTDTKKSTFSIVCFANLDLIRTDLKNNYTDSELATQLKQYIDKNVSGYNLVWKATWVQVDLSLILKEFDQKAIERMNIYLPRTCFRLDYEVVYQEDCQLNYRFRVDTMSC